MDINGPKFIVGQNRGSVKTPKPEDFAMELFFWNDVEYTSFIYRYRFLTRAIIEECVLSQESFIKNKKQVWTAKKKSA